MVRLNSGCVATVSEPRGAENRATAAEAPMGEKCGRKVGGSSMTDCGEKVRGNSAMVVSLSRLTSRRAGMMRVIEAAAEEEEEEEEEDDDFDDDRNLAVFATKCLLCLP